MSAVLENAKYYLGNLDLSYISKKMCSTHYHLPQWQPNLVAICETLYKRFLWLMIKYPDQHLVPTRDIDEFWHNHILYTKQYTADCQALAGHYIHHKPSNSDNNLEVAKVSAQFALTKKLYLQ